LADNYRFRDPFFEKPLLPVGLSRVRFRPHPARAPPSSEMVRGNRMKKLKKKQMVMLSYVFEAKDEEQLGKVVHAMDWTLRLNIIPAFAGDATLIGRMVDFIPPRKEKRTIPKLITK
jgi:hypothetical protein